MHVRIQRTQSGAGFIPLTILAQACNYPSEKTCTNPATVVCHVIRGPFTNPRVPQSLLQTLSCGNTKPFAFSGPGGPRNRDAKAEAAAHPPSRLLSFFLGLVLEFGTVIGFQARRPGVQVAAQLKHLGTPPVAVPYESTMVSWPC